MYSDSGPPMGLIHFLTHPSPWQLPSYWLPQFRDPPPTGYDSLILPSVIPELPWPLVKNMTSPLFVSPTELFHGRLEHF